MYADGGSNNNDSLLFLTIVEMDNGMDSMTHQVWGGHIVLRIKGVYMKIVWLRAEVSILKGAVQLLINKQAPG